MTYLVPRGPLKDVVLDDYKKFVKHLYYEKNKRKVIERSKVWAKNNPEKRKAIVKRNNEKSKLRKRLWHENRFFDCNKTLMTNVKCKLCKTKKDLLIHHNDGCNGENGKPTNNHQDNLIILCRSCHPKIHNSHWIKGVV